MNKFSKKEIIAIYNELEKIATTMEIPPFRRRDAGWILRNAAIENPNSKNLPKLIRLAKIIAELPPTDKENL